ncbi:hypothetical protein M413DRAFT_12776 [Hebeloma cylindrosporum]|uniref:F-box domain-containing protein n=1 Tax=Hebeloma cylindrosporum TaxID=76867 RepID=A0A0C3C2X5_HEBCY|nr:hypothetical protein M413DRAFT_12776 [Hebeloma cylindrosporum h7]
MAAKELYHEIPEIPEEIWVIVLRQATLDYEFPSLSKLTFESIGTQWSTSEHLRSLRKCLITKRNIVRVCKAWYALACPFLYEYIILGRNRVLAPLSEGLSRAALENRQVGQCTERLDVQMRDATQAPETVLATLADILTYLPNLCILTFSITGRGFSSSLPNVVLNSITSSGSLKYVQWYNSVAKPLPHPWTVFLQRHPKIEVLDGGLEVTLNAQINLDAVKILRGFPIMAGLRTVWSEVDLPAIRSMFYDVTYGVLPKDAVTFSRLGQYLTEIQLSFLVIPRVAHLNAAFARIRAGCTRLTQLVLLVRSWFMLGSYTPNLPPTVHTLGIRVVDGRRVSAASVKRLFTALLPFYVTRNPALETIKFMETSNTQALRSRPISLWRGLRVMEKLGVAVQDLDGRLIVPPSCPGVVRLQQELGKLSSTTTLDIFHPAP